jgi:tetratricopeptide (TPR) repeat protein
MPKRRNSDVVHAVMTDHFIQRRKPEGNLLAEMPEPNGPGTVFHGEVLPYYPRPFDRTAESELYLALAQVRESNNSEVGIARFAAAVAKYRPLQPEFYIELADAWISRGDSQKAIPLYREAVRRRSDSLAGLLGLGRALEKAGQPTGAAEAFRRATQAAPDDALSWRELGQIYVKQGKRAEAATALERSLQLDAEAPEAHYAFGLLWSQPGGDPGRAEASFREAIRLAPDYPEAHMNLAILLFERQRAEEAGYHFERALRYRPNYALAHLNYAVMLQKLNRTSEAALHLKQAGR